MKRFFNSKVIGPVAKNSHHLLGRLLLALTLFLLCAGIFWGAIPASERGALILFYNATNGDYWADNSGWKGNNNEADGFSQIGSEGTWKGVTVEGDRVTKIVLWGNNLVGVLPGELANLTQLKELRINNTITGLSGVIPVELGSLTHLEELMLIGNSLSGSIPSEIGNLSQLKSLWISENNLSGGLPAELGNLSNLERLDLDNNPIGGSIPTNLGNLGNLQVLDLNQCQLSGPIPSQLGNLNNLKELRLWNNELSGSIPPELGSMPNLENLHLGGNNLSGAIPSELGNLPKIFDLDLDNNNLSGAIPPELGNPTKLYSLSIGGNNLSGSIPSELGNSPAHLIKLNDNNLSGSIPPELGNTYRRLHLQNNNLSGSIPPKVAGQLDWKADLSNNNLSGSIPAELANCTLLEVLDLSHNNLSGEIPAGFDNCIILEILDFSHNNLSGAIPPGVLDPYPRYRVDLSYNNLSGFIPNDFSVYQLDLSHNILSGGIPTGLGDRDYIYKMNVSHNNLTGNIPAELGQAQNLQQLTINGNLLTGAIPKQITNLVGLATMDIGYNRLFTFSDDVSAFLNLKDPDWFQTQTIAPTGVSAVVTSPSSVQLSWTPIVYTGDNGSYQIFYSTTGSDPWTLVAMTGDKSTGNFEVTGLNYSTTYYFSLKTQTNPHSNNKNTAISEYSNLVQVTLSSSPFISVNKTSLSFSSFLGSPPPATQTITVSNSGSGSLQWSVSTSTGWITLSPSSGGDGDSISVSVDHSGLAAGTYNGLITITDANAANSPLNVPVQLVVQSNEPGAIVLNRTRFNFGAVKDITTGEAQSLSISNTGSGILQWIANCDLSCVAITPISGTGSAQVYVSMDHTSLAAGTYVGTISVSDANASNSPVSLPVHIIIKNAGQDQPPLGSFDSPITGSTVQSSIAVTGWALDDTGVENVKIYRGPANNEPGTRIFIGDAVLVEGARPDVEQSYPDYPAPYKAGWGYMLLTNFLPNEGNGTYTLYAVATDQSGNQATLGAKTIICDNANAVKPFGAIDTPVQGGSASGSAYVNFGWALTPQPNTIPVDGLTIDVWIDGMPVGHPVYNIYRSDIAALFPSYNNSSGAVGYFYMDTTAYENGVHTIAWSVKDNAGNSDGIGSRYFTIHNSANRHTGKIASSLANQLPNNRSPVSIQKGYHRDKYQKLKTVYPDAKDSINITIHPLQRLAVHLEPDTYFSHGYQQQGKRFLSLPIGSFFDPVSRTFTWQPGPGFAGPFQLVFISTDSDGTTRKQLVTITISSQ